MTLNDYSTEYLTPAHNIALGHVESVFSGAKAGVQIGAPLLGPGFRRDDVTLQVRVVMWT